MADLTTGNINTEAQTAASVNDGDYIYIYKADAGVFSKIEKSLLLQGAGGGSGSGISAEVYEAIKDNVNRVQGRLDALIGALANMAFNSLPKPETVGVLTWPEGTTPSIQTPSLDIKYNGAAVSSVNVTADTSGATDISFVVKAANLTSNNAFEFTLGGTSAVDCTLSTSSITAAQATSGATVTVTYSGTSAASATLSVSGNGLSASVNIAIAAAGSGLHTIIGTLTNCYIDTLTTVSAQVANGGTWTGVLVAESGYELPTINSGIITSGTAGSVSLSGSTLTISNITSDITFDIVASSAQQVAEYISNGLVLHLDGKNQGGEQNKWIDTTSAHKEFVLIGNPTVTSNGVTFSTDGVQQYGRYTGSVEDWPASSCTIEVCFTPTIDFDEEDENGVGLFGNSNNRDIAATFMPGDNRGFGFAAIAFNETGTRNYKRLLSSDTTINSDQGVTLSMNFERHMLNGVVDSSSRVNTRVGTLYGDEGLSVGGFLRAADKFVGCNAIIHEVRIYNRLLSEQDMKDNQKCDNDRYNLGLNI